MLSDIFEAIGKGIITSFSFVFRQGVPFLFRNAKSHLSPLLFVTFFFLLTFVSLKQSFAEGTPMPFLITIGQFFFEIDKTLYDHVQKVLTAGTFTFFNTLSVIGSTYIYWKFIKLIKRGIDQIYSDIATIPMIVYVSAFGILLTIQLIYSILATYALQIQDFYIPGTGIYALIWSLIVKSDIFYNTANRILAYGKFN